MTVTIEGTFANGQPWLYQDGEFHILGENAAGNTEYLVPCWGSLDEATQLEMMDLGMSVNQAEWLGKRWTEANLLGANWNPKNLTRLATEEDFVAAVYDAEFQEATDGPHGFSEIALQAAWELWQQNLPETHGYHVGRKEAAV